MWLKLLKSDPSSTYVTRWSYLKLKDIEEVIYEWHAGFGFEVSVRIKGLYVSVYSTPDKKEEVEKIINNLLYLSETDRSPKDIFRTYLDHDSVVWTLEEIKNYGSE